jgi:hydrogenase expression/formation protein
MEEVEVDVYGVSVDAILIFTNNPDVVIGELRKASIKADVVGRVEKYLGHPIYLEEGSTIKELKPNFRESPYTPVKKVVGNTTTFTAEVRSRLIRSAALNAAEKKERFTQLLNSRLAGDVKFKTS